MTEEEAKEQKMMCDNFKKKYNYRTHEKCCETCKWLRWDCDDVVDSWCNHSELKLKFPLLNITTQPHNVCDAWEK